MKQLMLAAQFKAPGQLDLVRLACRKGMPNSCSAMTTLGIFLDGGFVSYAVVPLSSLYIISTHASVEQAILGAGPIGVIFALLFGAGGAGKIVLTDTSPQRRETARRICPAAEALDPISIDPAETLTTDNEMSGAEVVVDAAGCLFEEAVRICRSGGSILLVGQDNTACKAIVQNDITHRELKIFGSYIACHTFPTAVRLLESGLLPLEKNISHCVPLSEIKRGFNALRDGTALKVLVEVN